MKTIFHIADRRHRKVRGFTLTELLVVIAIIAMLAVLSFLLVGSARNKAWACQSGASLRQCAAAIQGYVADKGRYPECYDFGGTGSGGGPWSWQIREHLGYGGDLGQWPIPLVLHPRHGTTGIDKLSNASRPEIHHFAASAIILQDVDEEKLENPKKYIRPCQIQLPAQVIVLGDAPLKQANRPEAGCHAAWWGLRFGAVTGNPGDPIDGALLRKQMDFWSGGTAQFLFADGHVEKLAPKDIKKRHFQL